MNANIVRLIQKDWGLHAGAFWLLVLMEIVSVIAMRIQMPRQAPGLVLPLAAGIAFIGDFLICYRTVVSEEKNRAMLFLQTLPLSRTDIVASKFLVNGVFVTLNSICLLLWYTLSLNLQLWPSSEPTVTFISLSVILAIHWLAGAFLVALALILDSERALWFVFSGLFAVLSAVLNYQKLIQALHLEGIVSILVASPALSAAPLLGMLLLTFWMTGQIVLRKRIFG